VDGVEASSPPLTLAISLGDHVLYLFAGTVDPNGGRDVGRFGGVVGVSNVWSPGGEDGDVGSVSIGAGVAGAVSFEVEGCVGFRDSSSESASDNSSSASSSERSNFLGETTIRVLLVSTAGEREDLREVLLEVESFSELSSSLEGSRLPSSLPG